MIGRGGLVQGQIKIVISEQDQVLRYLFPYARSQMALGIDLPQPEKIAQRLQQFDPFFCNWEFLQVLEYVNKKIIIYDLSNVIKNHWQYISKLLYILRRVNFQNEDYNKIDEVKNFL